MCLPICNHLSNLLHSPDKVLHRGSVTESYVGKTLAFADISDPSRIDVEKYTRDNDTLVLRTLLKKYKTLVEQSVRGDAGFIYLPYE